MRPTDVLNKIQREIKNSAKKVRHKTIRNRHKSIKVPVIEAEKPGKNGRAYSKEVIEKAINANNIEFEAKVLAMSDHDICDQNKNNDDNIDLADFIKDNIINKKSEYPEYDRATANGTINDLVRKSREMKRSQTKTTSIKGKKYVVESVSDLPKDGGEPGAIYFVPLVKDKDQRNRIYKTYRWFRDKRNPEGGHWQFNGFEAAEASTVSMGDPEKKIMYDNSNISLITDAERAVDLTINDKPNKKNHEDQADALSYSVDYIVKGDELDKIKDICDDEEPIQYVLDALHIKTANAFENSIEDCMVKINNAVDSKHAQWKKSHDKLESFDDLLEAAPYVDVFRNIKHVYIINGFARSGKDTFIEMAGEVFDFLESSKNTTKSISSVQGIKDISAANFGYDDSIKSDKDRKFLADFKNITTQYCDYSLNYVLKEIIRADLDGYSYIFIHIREPEEINRAIEKIDNIIFPHFSSKVMEYEYDTDKMFAVRKNFAPKTIFIKRDTDHKVINNRSDTDVENYEYDFIFDNNGSLDSLRLYAKHFAIEEFGRVAN